MTEERKVSRQRQHQIRTGYVSPSGKDRSLLKTDYIEQNRVKTRERMRNMRAKRRLTN